MQGLEARHLVERLSKLPSWTYISFIGLRIAFRYKCGHGSRLLYFGVDYGA